MSKTSNSMQMRTQRTSKVMTLMSNQNGWALVVDTEFLYMEAKKRYGRHARMDYLRLPINIVRGAGEIQFFIEKSAVVMRHSNVWESFASSLERFGYTIIPTEIGLHSRVVSMQAEQFLDHGLSLVLVSSLDRIADIITCYRGGQIKVFTFLDSSIEGVTIASETGCGVKVLEIDQEWLWKKG